jgi:hypothetical protein
MADLDKIMTALRNAHAAGDAAAAKRLAAMAKAAQSQPSQSQAMTDGMSKLSDMTRNPTASLDAEQDRRASERTVGQALYDNLIGDPNDGVDSAGERLGRGLNDAGGAVGAGLARGAAGLVTLPGDVGNMFNAGMTYAGKAAGVIPENWQAPTNPINSGNARAAMASATGGATDFRGDSRAAKFAGTVAEFLPGAAALGGTGAANLLRYGVAPGVASEAAGQATEGTSYEGIARVAGALAGGIAPDLLMKGASKLISPNAGADPERLKLASVLDDFGVPISAGQRVGNEALRRKEGLTGAGQRLVGEQQEAFTAAALKTAGINAKRATPEVLDEAAQRIGAVFDDVTRGLDVVPDSAAITKLSGAVNEYKSLAPTGNQAPLVSQVLKETTKFFRGGNAVPASTVNTWRSGLSKLTTSADAATREAARLALEAVDDMLEGAMRSAGKADDVARLATARSEWRNFLAIQKAAVREGDGLLSPARLRAAVINQGESAYARGKRGDLGALSRAGGEVMDTLPNSGTPAGIRAMIPGGSLSGGLGAALGAAMTATPMGAAIGAIGGMALPAISGAIRMSRPMQNYLANQAVPAYLTNAKAGISSALLPFAGETRNALAPR